MDVRDALDEGPSVVRRPGVAAADWRLRDQFPVRRFLGAAGAVASTNTVCPLTIVFPLLPDESTRLSTGKVKVPVPSDIVLTTLNVPVNVVPLAPASGMAVDEPARVKVSGPGV